MAWLSNTEWWRGFFPDRKPKATPTPVKVREFPSKGKTCLVCGGMVRSYRQYADGSILCLPCALNTRPRH